MELVNFSGSLDPYWSGTGIIKSLAQILGDFWGVQNMAFVSFKGEIWPVHRSSSEQRWTRTMMVSDHLILVYRSQVDYRIGENPRRFIFWVLGTTQKFAFWAIFDHMLTVGKAITMGVLVFQSKQKLFLNPQGAGYNIETKKYMVGMQEQTKSRVNISILGHFWPHVNCGKRNYYEHSSVSIETKAVPESYRCRCR